MMVSRIAAAAAAILTSLLLQASLVGPLTFPIPVSLPALLVILLGIYAGPGVGLATGFSAGLIADLGSEHPVGVQALCWLGAGMVAGIAGGLLARRGFDRRGVAALAAVLAAATSFVAGTLLSLLGSHGASMRLAVRDVLPVGLVDALIAFALVPPVVAMLRAQGVRAPRNPAQVLGVVDA